MLWGGEPHSGWLPFDASHPLPTPQRALLLDIEIQAEEGSFLLCYASTDGTTTGDNWYATLRDAEQAAFDDFGIGPDDWDSEESSLDEI